MKKTIKLSVLLVIALLISPLIRAQTVSTPYTGFNGPYDITFDHNNNAFISSHNEVIKITPLGVRTVFASGFNDAGGLATDNLNNLYVGDIGTGIIYVITPLGSKSVYASGFSSPLALTFNSQGVLYVAEYSIHTVSKVIAGNRVPFVVVPTIRVDGIAFDAQQNLYIGTRWGGSGQIYKADILGNLNLFTTLPGTSDFIKFAPDNNLYVVTGSSQVFKVTLAGAYTLVAGTGAYGNTDGPALSATFSLMEGISFDSNWNLFITEYYYGTVRKITGLGIVADSTADTDGDGYSLLQGDCNNNNANIYPGATEICNSLDDNCNGQIDEGFAPVPGAISGAAVQCLTAAAGTAIFNVSPVTGAIGYTWTTPAGVTITAGQGTTSITISWTSAAAQAGISGTLCLNALGTCGTGQSCVSLDLQVAKPVQTNSISGPAKVCPGDQVTYSVAALARATGYTWTTPTGISIATGQGTNIITATVGAGFTSGSLSVAATNACGVGASRSRVISLNPPAVPGSITGITNGVCNATGTAYSIAAVPGASNYLWSVTNGGTISGSNSALSAYIDWSIFTNATVSVASVNGCGTSVARTLNVNATPAQPGTITGASTVCALSTNHYSVATVTGATTYTWTNTVGASITGQGTKDVDITFGALAAYNQAVKVQATNVCGISLIRSFAVNIAACPRIGNINNDDINQAINVYPNPAHDLINVLFNAKVNAIYTLQLTDLTGKLISTKTGVASGAKNQLSLDAHQLIKGMYFVRLLTEQGTSQMKVIVE